MYRDAKAHFKKTDPVLHQAALQFEIEDLVVSKDLFRDIIWTIIGQQLSGKAADAIFGRFRALVKGSLTPQKVLALSEEVVRAAGVSGAKMRAIRDFATSVESRTLALAQLRQMSDADVVAQLTKVKGIGPWTAEMILMFSLGRADVFSKGDLGLQKGLVHLYRLRKFPSDKQLAALSARWSPYRTYAARVLWKVNDTKTVRAGRKRPA